jgi:hypothetical protein
MNHNKPSKLHPYQQQVIDSISKQPTWNNMVFAQSGSGKSVTSNFLSPEQVKKRERELEQKRRKLELERKVKSF